MLEIGIFHIFSIAFLLVGIVSTYLANSSGGSDKEHSYDAVVTIKLRKVIDYLWLLATLILPFIFIIILAVVPSVIYGNYGTFPFQGDILVQITGLLLAGLGFILLIWSGKTLGRYDVTNIALDRTHVLIDNGPYSKIRHPGYTSNFLLNLGLWLFSLNVIIAINLVVIIVLSIYRARLEEQLLSSEKGFGQQYKEYMEHTDRFLPHF